MVLHATYPQTLCPTTDMQPTCSSDECPFLQVRLQTLLKQYLFTDSATLPFHRHFTWELSVTENPSSKCGPLSLPTWVLGVTLRKEALNSYWKSPTFHFYNCLSVCSTLFLNLLIFEPPGYKRRNIYPKF